ncbi:MAG: hypothetical protein A4E45_01722 [Methanosaeta sp. PtaB.Bin039]|nr:MAG: hypothetical protein A4E45_01722 [Methanosaeta sp. PtaB.Bin039]
MSLLKTALLMRSTRDTRSSPSRTWWSTEAKELEIRLYGAIEAIRADTMAVLRLNRSSASR